MATASNHRQDKLGILELMRCKHANEGYASFISLFGALEINRAWN